MNNKSKEQESVYAWIYNRFRNEAVLEIGFLILCFLLAIGLEVKVVVAVTIASFKFAIPDFITAFLVFKNDFDRWHAVIMSCYFLATGMARAAICSGIVVLVGSAVAVPLLAKFGLADIATLGLGFSFIWATFFIACVFPMTVLGLLISLVTGTQVSFATGLTRLRRSAADKRDSISLNINQSLSKLAVASGISLGIWLLVLGFLLPLGKGPLLAIGAIVIVLSAFGAPFGWIYLFERLTHDKSAT